MINTIKNLANAMTTAFSKRNADASRTAGAGEGPHILPTPELQRPHYQQIADVRFFAELGAKRGAEIERRISFDLET